MRLALLLALAGCASPRTTDQFRYTVIAYDAQGVEINRAEFGERYRGGRIIVIDKDSSKRLRVNPDVGLNVLNQWAK